MSPLSKHHDLHPQSLPPSLSPLPSELVRSNSSAIVASKHHIVAYAKIDNLNPLSRERGKTKERQHLKLRNANIPSILGTPGKWQLSKLASLVPEEGGVGITRCMFSVKME
ncbi:unnamed protein product [Dovyalis caffra]|uniref:Uncharacterized protein n=1 Tax=Dovyalis caffra TaxID=77055 RepID=A0AAV1SBC5_9ROSI|nr:unnamed protein product [Dovyalis caffra]